MSGVLHKFQSRRKFTTEEDSIIRAFVAQYGESCWEFIAPNVPGRTPRQCRNRYRNNLKPNFTSAQWTMEEDIYLRNKYNELGPRWTLISQYFHGRSPSSIKNRWNYYVSKQDLQFDYRKENKNNLTFHQEIDPLGKEEDTDKSFSSSSSPSLDVSNNIEIDNRNHIEIDNRNLPVIEEKMRTSSGKLGVHSTVFNDAVLEGLENDYQPFLSEKDISEIESLFDDADLTASI